ncbi:AraC family transcriptional regulator [Mycobacterium malmoense]|uniref:AraC family transcriptional regulator n=1 Tax=Mycobacterium malmoense TaxID=1780 RepID=UPI0008F94017|nr:AraC family transcriptional regulator [Mycobacterium malmoense]
MYQELRPDRRLAPLVECGWIRSGPASRPLRVMPDGCVDLFVSSGGHVMIAGPATTFYDLPPGKGCVLAGLRLRPGAAGAIVGRPVSEFTDRRVLLDSIFGVRGRLMAEMVLAATTPSQRVAALETLLTGYLAGAEPLVDTAVTRAIGIMRRHPGRPVSSLAVAVDLSERQLRRRFETAVGYGPKRFGRILRFQRLLDLIHTRGARARWAELAIEANYADQPHMINECLALAGVSPVALPGGVSVSSNTTPGDTS